VVTLGNHSFGKRQIVPMLEENRYLLRPANQAPQLPGIGWNVYECGRWRIGVIDLIGRCKMDFGPDNPFTAADRILREMEADVRLVDFHTEATSEKAAMAYHLAGRVSAVWGTHTHVPTADERIFPKGTGFITDLGMTGPLESVIGVRPEQSVTMFLGGLPGRFEPADGPCKLDACLFEIDPQTGLCTALERLNIRD
jgi:metallophosphoesterase (TIGR00282 family)